MIYGFNTDVRRGDLVYHVQSEIQHGQTLLQTQVFVGGRCIGKCELPISDVLVLPVRGDCRLQDLLRSQHRQVLEAVRKGEAESLFVPAHMSLQWLDGGVRPNQGGLVLTFAVKASERPLAGASVFGQIDCVGREPVFAEAETATDGVVRLQFAVERSLLADATVLVEAVRAGQTVSSRFRLHTSGQAACPLGSANDLFA